MIAAGAQDTRRALDPCATQGISLTLGDVRLTAG
jgi:hypothetical protein